MWNHPSVYLRARREDATAALASRGPGTTTPASTKRLDRAERRDDKDAPLATFESRVPVKVDVASWLRANPGAPGHLPAS